jgi:putative ATP-dependent endonuclease of OLD family
MYLNRYCLRNFRRLEDVEIKLEETDTIFVGANNSGKTSATAAFRLFVSQRGDFKIYDFSSPLISELDSFGDLDIQPDIDYEKQIPAIELDLWFTVTSSIYGRVAHLLPSITSEYTEVGVRIRFAVNKPDELHKAYRSIYPKQGQEQGDGPVQKSLSYFLSQGGNLKQYFGLHYFMLEKITNSAGRFDVTLHLMDKDNGRKTIDSLLHIDYVDAQRNIDDNDSARSNRLSAAFTNYYKNNLKKQALDNASLHVIDESNSNLTKHYAEQFSPLINVIKALGFPALNDRALRIVSNLSAEQALSGNTAVMYVENGTEHELPEAYNGLGFKNLIYIAIQITQFQIQWAEMGVNRPLCQLVFVEEPEAHLHAQVQQTFIRQIRKVMKEIEGISGDSGYVQQLVVTTHSSHIIAEANFQSIRYFRRTKTKYPSKTSTLTASETLSLANFNPESKEPDNLEFLRKFIKLTHCDLFFADAAILVEGTVERLLMPMMIKKEAEELESVYLTTIELGGAYAHRFVQLLEFINLPTLVVTDLDSVDPTAGHSTCRADQSGAVTSNASIKELTKKESISDLLTISDSEKTTSIGNFHRYITFQQSVAVTCYGEDIKMIPRTFEEAFIYENISSVRDNKIKVFVTLPAALDYGADYQKIYESVKSKDYKKVEFALAQIDTKENWITPAYIGRGLKWLSKTLGLTAEAKPEVATTDSLPAEQTEGK